MTRLTMCFAAAALLAGPVAAADPTACDTTAIKWHLPDEFATARKAAGQEKRILMIKGIAFGVDEAGARCATKGCW
jgi:hypothetical protein